MVACGRWMKAGDGGKLRSLSDFSFTTQSLLSLPLSKCWLVALLSSDGERLHGGSIDCLKREFGSLLFSCGDLCSTTKRKTFCTSVCHLRSAICSVGEMIHLTGNLSDSPRCFPHLVAGGRSSPCPDVGAVQNSTRFHHYRCRCHHQRRLLLCCRH